MTDLLTLDTNALVDLCWSMTDLPAGRHSNLSFAERTRKRDALLLIAARSEQGQCSIAIPAQHKFDFAESRNVVPDKLQVLIGKMLRLTTPSLATYPIVYPFVYFDKQLFERLFKEVFPHSRPEHKKYRSSKIDALLIYAHIVARRTTFITSDGALWDTAGAVLKEQFAVDVCTPEKYAEHCANAVQH